MNASIMLLGIMPEAVLINFKMKFSDEFEKKTKDWPITGGLIIGLIAGLVGLIIDDGDISSRLGNGFIYLIGGYCVGALLIIIFLFFVNMTLSASESGRTAAMKLYIIFINTAALIAFTDWLFLGSHFVLGPLLSLLLNGTVEGTYWGQ